jgi:dTDP-4-dehydrorhamnose reductase
MKRERAPKATAILIGADGMLGSAMTAELAARRWECIAPTRDELDLSRPETIRRFFRWTGDARAYGPPNFIINCAAWTDVDGAEQQEAEATAINADAIGELVALCRMDTTLLTFSTDYVFDGRNTEPYTTDHPRAPINAYGRSKAAGEAALDAHPNHDWLNIRTSWLYAPWAKNFVLTMRKLLFEKPQLRVVDDQRGRPTSAQHLARTSLALLDRSGRGHHHVTDGGECTWYEFTLEIKRLLGAPAEVLPCSSTKFPRPAMRPAYSVLDLSRTETLLGPMPHWKQNLADVIAQLTS